MQAKECTQCVSNMPIFAVCFRLVLVIKCVTYLSQNLLNVCEKKSKKLYFYSLLEK